MMLGAPLGLHWICCARWPGCADPHPAWRTLLFIRPSDSPLAPQIEGSEQAKVTEARVAELATDAGLQLSLAVSRRAELRASSIVPEVTVALWVGSWALSPGKYGKVPRSRAGGVGRTLAIRLTAAAQAASVALPDVTLVRAARSQQYSMRSLTCAVRLLNAGYDDRPEY